MSDFTNFLTTSGNQDPFTGLKVYLEKEINSVRGSISLVRFSTINPTASDIAAGKYAAWYNTTSSTFGIWYNNNGSVTQYSPSGGGGTPGGSTTQVQYNNAGAFAGITGATTNGTVVTLTSPVISTITNTGTLTLPTSTDTLIGKATTDILTNKTFDTAGTGNVFKINGVQVSAVTGTGSNVLATTPTLVTPVLGVATATSVNKVTITAPTTSATLTLVTGSTLATAGAFSTTLTATATTNVTLPTTGTLPSSALSTGTVTAGASIDVNFSAYFNLYTIIEVIIYGIIPATNATNVLMRTSADGTTFDAGANNYAWAMGFLNSNATLASAIGSGGNSQGDTSVTLAGGLVNTAAIGTTEIRLKFFNPSNTSNYKSVECNIMAGNVSASSPALLWGIGQRLATTAVKGARILMSSGNITGSYTVIGYK